MARAGRPVDVVMVGIGGYGRYYTETLLEGFPPGAVRLRGAVDPAAEKCVLCETLKNRRIPVYTGLDEFFAAGLEADLAVLSSPIHHHIPQSITSLEHGCHVLCDKPLGTVVQEVDALLWAREAAGRWVEIGYQWSFSAAVQALKQDIIAGRFGAPRRFKTLCFWPRDYAYYRRNDWAGRLKDDSGRWVLDSPANNAMAHFLHNLFFLLGETAGAGALPIEVSAELYRAYPIENFDTCACRAVTAGGVELLFYASHAAAEDRGPMFDLEFEEASVTFGAAADEILAADRRGRRWSYGSPEDDNQFLKLFRAVEAAANQNPAEPVCGPEAAYAQLLCVNGFQDSVREVTPFPDDLRRTSDDGVRLWVRGLDEALLACYGRGLLPSEAGIAWARAGRAVDLSAYYWFPGGEPPGEESR